ncbi:MAG: DNA-processing protein DprA [Candidatus Omnitrophica bacterium]|nr:DNA-processing protein DprA [Candidatus Omnitrophota bacterium]
MNSLEALISLNMVSDIGSQRLERLLDLFGKPENIFGASKEKLMLVPGIGEKISGEITSFNTENLDRELTLASKLGLKIVTLGCLDYPESLRNIPGSPLVLYYKGSLIAEDRLSISIVGSRLASFYGLESAKEFSSALAERGFTIVSGLAKGIDTYAHKGALRAGGRTLAIMGSGFNNIYPQQNIDLAEEIAKNGAVISEFPINTKPFKQNFPRRNRIISGLSLGVLVVEAARNSGALITADFALEQGREVFALPGRVDSVKSSGTNELIKQGAKLVTCVDDIVEEFGMPVISCKKQEKPLLRKEVVSLNSKEESDVYSLISDESTHLDTLVEKTSLDISKISGIILKLQLMKLIKQLPGKQFVRSGNER